MADLTVRAKIQSNRSDMPTHYKPIERDTGHVGFYERCNMGMFSRKKADGTGRASIVRRLVGGLAVGMFIALVFISFILVADGVRQRCEERQTVSADRDIRTFYHNYSAAMTQRGRELVIGKIAKRFKHFNADLIQDEKHRNFLVNCRGE
jgi:hypothetical protein